MCALRETLEKLNRRKTDLKTKLDTMIVPGEIEEVEEVKFWLERVEKIIREVDRIGDEAKRVKFFSRAGLGRRVAKMKPKVVELYEEGAFAEGSLVRMLPQRGNERPTVAKLGGQTTTEKTRGEILGCLVDENATRIGVHGMGGIGKTTVLEHIHNSLLKDGNEIGSKFDKVIWITVSKASGLIGLQDKIARAMDLSTSNDDDEEMKAMKLYREFNKAKNKRYTLILDDMWEAYPLEKVGIPNPTPENGCKLVLTTRSGDACSEMKCDRTIAMGCLSEQEAMELFLDGVGKSVASDPKLVEMVRRVARECAGLPLAIITMAGSLRDKMDPDEWVVALTELKDAAASMSNKITAILRFSYDRLKDEKLKDCLLYCALYPEDYLIKRNLLIDQLIAEGIVEEGKTRQSPTKKGQAMLNKLVRNCLLIDAINRGGAKCVKLHDLIRDMAIQIMRESPSRFVAEAGRGLESLKPEEIWNEHVEKVSLMGNKIAELRFTEPPKCPRLSTLFLNVNYNLQRLSEDLFLQMEGLLVLDLSNTNIERLPKSVSILVNLNVLLLRCCRNLVHVPDLSELRNLRSLDFHQTRITEVPKGMEMMDKLTYLDLSFTKLESLPKGVLRNLSNLQFLSLAYTPKPLHVSTEELANLAQLETLSIFFAKMEDFNAYVSSPNSGRLANFVLKVGVNDFTNWKKKNLVSLSSINERLEDGGGFPLMLPENVEHLNMNRCPFRAKSLCRLASVEKITNLTALYIVLYHKLECLFYYSSGIAFPLLLKTEDLVLSLLSKFRGVFCTESGAPSPVPPGSFSSLKTLNISYCNNLKTMFVMSDIASLPNLETIDIRKCKLLEEIITPNEGVDDVAVNYTVTLPKLKELKLQFLPKLEIIPFVADSLKFVVIRSCHGLKNIFFLDADNCPASLKSIDIDADPWKSRYSL